MPRRASTAGNEAARRPERGEWLDAIGISRSRCDGGIRSRNVLSSCIPIWQARQFPCRTSGDFTLNWLANVCPSRAIRGIAHPADRFADQPGHAKATRANMRLQVDRDKFILAIGDNGRRRPTRTCVARVHPACCESGSERAFWGNVVTGSRCGERHTVAISFRHWQRPTRLRYAMAKSR